MFGGDTAELEALLDLHARPVIRRALAPMEDDRDLQDPLTTIGMLFSQVAMAAARVRDGRPRGRRDDVVFKKISGLLDETAKWLRYVKHGGNQPATPAFLAGEITQERWFLSGGPRDPAEVADTLEALSRDVSRLATDEGEKQLAGTLYTTFQGWAEGARAGAGSNGDSALVS
jgi:hypothetical protein